MFSKWKVYYCLIKNNYANFSKNIAQLSLDVVLIVTFLSHCEKECCREINQSYIYSTISNHFDLYRFDIC
ncbi:hypothetical protein V1477_006606 [Vespula maculifrons]|uniref:Uncharacterized protein n=1 Tax=Vespula maculifrons TaxID=7453 RepID=A0ABD2CK24_VESMC